MNKLHMIILVLLILGVSPSGHAQGSGVHSEYMKDNKTTRVETNMLYVLNTPDQFVELMLRSWYKGDKLTAPPTKSGPGSFFLLQESTLSKRQGSVRDYRR